LTIVGNGASYTVDLTGVTAGDGLYVLTLTANGVTDLAGNALGAEVATSWSMDTSSPVADIVDVSPDPRNAAVSNATLLFTESVTGLGVDDLSLTRDGTVVDISGLNITGADDTFSIDLSTATALSGEYVLTMTAAGITDLAGNAVVADVSDTWIVDATPPTADIVDVAPDPRNTSVSDATITFSESVIGLDISDLALTRDGAVVDISGLIITGAADTFSIDLTTVTATEGIYELTLIAAGVTDLTGNTVAADAVESWANDQTVPTVDIVDIDPDPRSAVVSVVNINFDEPVTGVTIDDFTLMRSGQPVDISGLTVNGTAANYTINLSSVTTVAGDYQLELIAAGSGILDLVGNALVDDASDDWTFNSPQVFQLVAPVSFNADQTDPADLPRGVQPTSWNKQRSMIRTIDLDFSFEANPTPADFRLTNLGIRADVDPDTTVMLDATNIVVSNNRVSLTFDTPLDNGVYELEILGTLTDILGNGFDGNNDGAAGDSFVLTGDLTNRFYVLHAEWSGDYGVSVFDFTTFSYWFGRPVPQAPLYADLNRDGGISVFDFSTFSNNFGIGVAFPNNFSDGRVTNLANNGGNSEVQLTLQRQPLVNDMAERSNPAKMNDAVLMNDLVNWQETLHEMVLDEISIETANNNDNQLEIDELSGDNWDWL
jgi:hypothetical protein